MSAIPPRRRDQGVTQPIFGVPRTLPNPIVTGQTPLSYTGTPTPFQLQPFGPNGQGWSPQVPPPAAPTAPAPTVGGNIGTWHGPTSQFGGVAPQSGPLFDAVRQMLGRGGSSWYGGQPQGQAGTMMGQANPQASAAYGGQFSKPQQPKMTIQGGSMDDIMKAFQSGSFQANDLMNRMSPGDPGYGAYSQMFDNARNQQGQSATELMEELLDRLNERRTERTTRARANRSDTRTSDRPARRTSSTNRNPGSNRRRMNDLW